MGLNYERARFFLVPALGFFWAIDRRGSCGGGAASNLRITSSNGTSSGGSSIFVVLDLADFTATILPPTRSKEALLGPVGSESLLNDLIWKFRHRAS